jgi:8-hydroxy-5-deazaflavin:NADPH oxidoreductase
MKIGVVGSGLVAQTLGAGFRKHGHEVMLGTREARKLADWAAKNPGARVGDFAATAAFGEIVVLSVAGTAALDVLRLAGAANISGKTVIDTCNPAGGPAVNGVLTFFTSLTDSLMERLQKAYPDAHFVKAFNSVGAAQMIDPQFALGPPTMFICGDHDESKRVVTMLLDQVGWETADMGAIEAARAIEPLCMLWCIPGLARNDWSPHAFKLLRG